DFSSGGTLRIVGVNNWANPFTTLRSGSVRIGYGATNLVYQPNLYSFGTNVLTYDVADNNGTNTGIAKVIVHALPQATITAPPNGTNCTSTPVNIRVTGTAQDFDGSITRVALYVNGLSNNIATTTNSFSFNWSSSTAGFYTFVAVAKDNDGFTNGSAPVSVTIDPPGGNPPIADITNLVNDTTNLDTL